MNTRGVEAFIVVAQMRNINHAAATLHLAQSTVSKRIQLLEEEIGVVLFERKKGTRTLQLTSAGEIFQGIAERAAAIDREVSQLRHGALSQKIAIGALDTHSHFMAECYANLVKHNPRMSITIHSLNSNVMYDAVITKMIDIGFTSLEAAYPPVKVDKFFSEPMIGICRKGSPVAAERIMETSALEAQCEIYVPWSVHFQIWHDRFIDPSPIGRVVTYNTPILSEMLMDERLWAIVPVSVAGHYFDMRQFQAFQINPKPPDRVCYKLTRRNTSFLEQKAMEIADVYINKVIDKKFGQKRDGENILNSLFPEQSN